MLVCCGQNQTTSTKWTLKVNITLYLRLGLLKCLLNWICIEQELKQFEETTVCWSKTWWMIVFTKYWLTETFQGLSSMSRMQFQIFTRIGWIYHSWLLQKWDHSEIWYECITKIIPLNLGLTCLLYQGLTKSGDDYKVKAAHVELAEKMRKVGSVIFHFWFFLRKKLDSCIVGWQRKKKPLL